MSVVIDSQVFARLVGRYPDRDTLLFEVAVMFIPDGEEASEWSVPVEYRFVRRKGALVELEMRTLDIPEDD